MAEINLLKQKTSGKNFFRLLPVVAVRLLVVCLALAVVYYGWLFFQVNKVQSEIVATSQQINNDQSQAQAFGQRNELLTRQLQLQTLNKLISQHVYWSQVFPELAKVTLKSANFSSLNATQGTMTLAVTLPDLNQLDKFMQVFNNPEFNANFYNLRIGAFHQIQNGSTTAITLEVKLDFNPAILLQKNAT